MSPDNELTSRPEDGAPEELRIPLSALPIDRVNTIETKEWESLEPNSERAQEIDKELATVATLFEGENINWRLDGAINISLRRGEYYREHKDLDISILDNDVPQFFDASRRKGYAIYYVDPSETMPVAKEQGYVKAESVTPEDVSAGKKKLILLRRDGDSYDFNSYIDVHVLEKNEGGKIIEYPGITLPDEVAISTESVQKESKDVPLQPAVVTAHHKLWSSLGRPTLNQVENYDLKDLEYLAAHLRETNPEQLEYVRSIITQIYTEQVPALKRHEQGEIDRALKQFQKIFS